MKPSPGQLLLSVPDTCPQCGAELRLRTGPYSTFLGCSTYPRCRHITQLTEVEVHMFRDAHSTQPPPKPYKPKRRRNVTAVAGEPKKRRRRGGRSPQEARTEALLEKEFRSIIG